MQEKQILNRISKAEQRIVDLYRKFLSGGVGGLQTLANVLVTGQRTGGNNIIVDDADAIELNNTSLLKKGTYNFGGNGGISRICSNNYEDMWQNGFRHVFDQSGFIRHSTNCFNVVPDTSFDVTLRFAVGSLWTLDDGTTYKCIDNTTGAAVWELYFSPVSKYKVYTALLTQSGTGVPVATVLENTLGSISFSYDGTGIYKVLSSNLFTPNKTAAFITSQGFGVGFGVVSSVVLMGATEMVLTTQSASSGPIDGNLNKSTFEIRVYN